MGTNLFYNIIIPELRKEGIVFVDDKDKLKKGQREYLKDIFMYEIFPCLEPVMLISKRIQPFLKTGHIYLVLKLYTKINNSKKAKKGTVPKYSLIKLPTDYGISRFVEIPKSDNKYYIIFLEDL